MGYTYNSRNRQWGKKELEKTDYDPEEFKIDYDEKPQKLEYYYAPETVYETQYSNCASKSTTYTPGASGSAGTFQEVCVAGPVSVPVTKYVEKTRYVLDEEKAKEAKAANKVGRIGNASNVARNKVGEQVNNLYNKIEALVKSKTITYLEAKKEITAIGSQLKKVFEKQKDLLIKAGASATDIEEATPKNFVENTINQYIDSGGYFRNYYLNERVSSWDSKLGAKTPAEALGDTFDPDFYLNKTKTGQAADAAYDKAVANDDLDILGRFDRNSYALYNYTYVGKPAGERGSAVTAGAAEALKTTKEYQEKIPTKTDAAYTFTRDKIFGLEEQVEKNKISENAKNYQLRDINEKLKSLVEQNTLVTEAWESAKRQLLYAQQFPDEPKGNWIQLTEALKLDPKKINDASYFGKVLVGALAKPAYLSDEEHKTILAENKDLVNELKQFQKQVKDLGNIEIYSTELDQVFLDVAGKKEEETVQKFGEMRKEVLEEARRKMIAAQQKESNLSLIKSVSGLNELENLQSNLQTSILGDLDIGGLYGLAGQKETTNPFKNFLNMDLGISSVFGTKNGLIYNWEDWFFKEIEKKYAGGIDIPDDYVSPLYRTKEKGYIDTQTLTSWKKYDDAYSALAKNPNDQDAKEILKTLPKDYIKENQRKEIKQSWLDFEAARLAAGFVDNKTLLTWEKYDQAYEIINTQGIDKNSSKYKEALSIYNKAPQNYVAPNKRVNFDVLLAQNFFTDYLKPRFDQSKSLSEFQSYLDVEKGEENIFQTEDRMTALKRATEFTLTTWFSNLQKLGPSSFDAAFYKDPISYYKKFGVRDQKQIILDSTKFNNYVSEKYTRQKENYNEAWAAAKENKTSKDFEGKDIDWNAWAYHYGLDLKNENDFAYLHYLVLGRNAPKLDANGKVVKDANGNIVKDSFDPAPDIFGTEVNKVFLKEVLTPFLKKKMDQIGSVFGEFVRPEEFVDEFFKNLDLTKNKEELSKLFDLYGLKETADLTELKQLMIEGLSGAEGEEIRNKVDDILKEGGTPTQVKLGIDYIQREDEKSTGRETTEQASGLYKIFQSAGYQGTEESFYSEFMPDATEEDVKLFSAITDPKKLKDMYTVDLSGGPEKVLSQISELMGEEQEDIYSMEPQKEIDTILSKMKEQAGLDSRVSTLDQKTDLGDLFKLDLPEEREEKFSSKINTGSDFLSQYKTSNNALFASAFS